MENDIITTKVAKIWMGEDNIIRIFYFQNVDITLQDAKEILEISMKLNRGKQYPMLIDARQVKSISPKARKYNSGQEASTVYTVAAVLIGSPVSRMIANFVLKFNKPLMPTKLFTDENQAIVWLKGFL